MRQFTDRIGYMAEIIETARVWLQEPEKHFCSETCTAQFESAIADTENTWITGLPVIEAAVDDHKRYPNSCAQCCGELSRADGRRESMKGYLGKEIKCIEYRTSRRGYGCHRMEATGLTSESNGQIGCHTQPLGIEDNRLIC